MAVKFNPFTAQLQLDQVGAGGGGGPSYIDGEVAVYADLSLDAGVAPLNSAWLVREASGIWPVSRKQAGIYIRTATGGSSRDADYTYAGTMPDVFSDAVFTLYDDASTTRTGQFNLGPITAGQNRVLTWPDGNGTIARTSDIPSTFAASAISDSTSAGRALLTAADASAQRTSLGLGSAAISASTDFAAASHAHAASAITSGVLDNARINFAAPSAIGSTTPSTGAFTTLSANNGTLTASAPAFSVTQALNNSGVTFEMCRFEISGAGAATSTFINCLNNSAVAFSVRRDGTCLANTYISNNGFRAIGNGNNGGQVILSSNGYYCFNDSTTSTFGTQDLFLRRDAAGVLAQYNGTNAQTFRIYNTFTSSTNFERLNIIAQSGAAVIIGTEKGSGGGVARDLIFQTDATNRLTLGATGAVTSLSTPAGSLAIGVVPTTTSLGTRAICIQADRSLAADRVPVGTDSIAIGNSSQAQNSASTALGFRARATGNYSVCIGGESAATATNAIAIGEAVSASQQGAIAIGGFTAGGNATAVNAVALNEDANLRGQFSTRPFRAVYWGGTTTDATANVELFLDATASNRLTLANNTALVADILIIGNSTASSKSYWASRRVAIRKDTGNVALIGAVAGTDGDSTASTPWSFTIDADTTNQALRIRVTGEASTNITWRATAIYRLV